MTGHAPAAPHHGGPKCPPAMAAVQAHDHAAGATRRQKGGQSWSHGDIAVEFGITQTQRHDDPSTTPVDREAA